MNEHFTWYRLHLLIRRDLIACYRSVLIASTTIAIIMCLQAFPAAYLGKINNGFYYGWFGGLLFIWGAIAASMSFSDLHDKTKNDSYLLLPASALEKTVARIVFVTVLFVAYQLLFTTLISLLAEGINTLAFGRHNALFNPFAAANWYAIALYFGGHGVFFLGAAWFRKAHLLKTCFTLALLAIGFLVLAACAFRIAFAEYFDGLQMLRLAEADVYWANKELWDGMRGVLKVAFFGLLSPFCWYVAWLRVRETQVSHGV